MKEELSSQKKRTRNHLKQALTTLTKEKGFHQVTVKDIVALSEYNRSTFYTHYMDKYELADDLLNDMMNGLTYAVAQPYLPGEKVLTSHLSGPSLNIISFIYEERERFTLLNVEDTIPGLIKSFPETILSIYVEQFSFETINQMPVNMDYFKRYTAYGFYGLLEKWIGDEFVIDQETFIQEVIDLTRAHMHALKYVGK